MRLLLFSGIICLCFVSTTKAQDKSEVLFKINQDDYYVEDFISSYQKNVKLPSVASEPVEEHLERFINFHLKLKAAYDLGLDTLPAFKKEYQSYYTQIAGKLISSGKVTEAMLREMYDRTKTEVRASHILLTLDENEKDTTAVYNRALILKNRIENGEDFESLAKRYSQDQSVRFNGGDVNWFNSFMMVYEFESKAYELDVDQVSDPVRTEFGYHIIKKTGERPSKGKLKTAHIMLKFSDSLSDVKAKIQKIYNKLQDGEDFHELAKTYSQESSSASSGGYISEFSLGGLNSKTYENEAYKLKHIGDYSEPFKSNYGWHIVKLIETSPLASYEEMKDQLKNKLKSSSRSKLLVSKIKQSLEKLYDVDINEEAKTYFIDSMGEDFKKGKWVFDPDDEVAQRVIIRVEDLGVDFKSFGQHIESQQRPLQTPPPNAVVVQKAIDDFVYKKLIAHHKTQLPEFDNDFKLKMKEFKNGILIFDFMSQLIWEPIAKDSVAQKDYYTKNAKDFVVPEQVVGKLYTSKNKTSLKKLKALLATKATHEATTDALPEDVILENVSLGKSSPKLPKRFKFELGMSKLYKHNEQFMIMRVEEVVPSEPQKFEAVKGKIISRLQAKKEKQVVSELRSQNSVVIMDDVARKLKQQFEK